MTNMTTAREPTLVRFATPYLEVETQSIPPLERVIERELAEASLAANKHRRRGYRPSSAPPPRGGDS